MDPAAERPDPQGRSLSDDGEDVPWCLERIAPSPMEPQDDRAMTPARTKRHRCTARSARFTNLSIQKEAEWEERASQHNLRPVPPQGMI